MRKPVATTVWATPSDWQQGIFCIHQPTDKIVHTMALIKPVVEHWLERENLLQPLYGLLLLNGSKGSSVYTNPQTR